MGAEPLQVVGGLAHVEIAAQSLVRAVSVEHHLHVRRDPTNEFGEQKIAHGGPNRRDVIRLDSANDARHCGHTVRCSNHTFVVA